MTELLFNKRLQVLVKSKDTDERRSVIRVSIELQLPSSPVHRKDLVVRLTDDTDLYFLYNLIISEEDFQSLKVQQGLLIDFTSFPQKFIDLLEQCICEQDKENPRFLLQLSSSSSAFDHSPSNLNIVETNAFKHLTHLSLKLLPGSDTDIKKYLASCLSSVKEEKQQLQQKLRKTEEDLTRQLNYAQQTLSEKSRELDKLRSEWTSQTTSLSSRHMQDLTAEREKALETQSRLQQQNEQLRQELESSHHRSTQQLQTKVSELETANRELIDKKYKSDSTIRDLKAKLTSLEEECQRSKQQVLSLRRENSALDSECHEKERLLNQLQTRVAVLEQEIKDKDQLVLRTKEVLEATQQQKNSVEGNAESKQLQISKLESTVKSLSEELIKANGIIKKLQADLKALLGKIKVKNSVTVSQEKILQETSDKLQRQQRELQDTQQRLSLKEEEAAKLKEQLEATVQKLDESREVLKTNENVITWLNKQLNENQLSRKQETVAMFETPAAALRSAAVPHNMLDSKGLLSSLGQAFPITSTINSKYPLALSCVSSGSRSVLTSSNGPKVQFNPMSVKPSAAEVSPAAFSQPANKENSEPVGLDSKYFERRDDSIPLRGLLPSMHLNREVPKPLNTAAAKATPSAFFPG
ncbi:spindle assembly abnormal protein 6 homolog isoform X1 [Danio rerio]|uniref:Spindle assembly abnormal protein 6 homolog n=1 Tax=Danio rerio TaxID=7955 RepID=A0A8M2BL83_DANRE|nr:spindle assembly abnormal protein 6 homolog isoform X1 [Danio rerio]|eukprot:XP_005174001.1 spindle assembly abnormal protein 6 homolog isoform X1 [Danio rerio]